MVLIWNQLRISFIDVKAIDTSKLQGMFQSSKIQGIFESSKMQSMIKLEKLKNLNKNVKIGIGAGILGVAVISTALYMNMGTDIYKLTIAGQDAGYLPNAEMIAESIEDIQTDLSAKADGVEIIKRCNRLCTYGFELESSFLLDEDQLKELILSANLCKANA